MYFIIYASRDGYGNQVLANCLSNYQPIIWLDLMLRRYPETVLVDWDGPLQAPLPNVAIFDREISC